MTKEFKNKTLTIAGSDSGAGAGIQADLKTFSSLGVYGSTVITAVTAQNTVGVHSFEMLSESIVESQINSVMSDIGASSIKTGMLGSSSIINTVCKTLRNFNFDNLVVDPVMVAESGDVLLEKSAINAYINNLIPLSTLITPNILEAEKISGINIDSEETIILAGKKMLEMGSKKVLIKGGHLNGEFSEDFLFGGDKILSFKERRINTKNTHGTGCTLSAAITAYLSKGISMEQAIRMSKEYITKSLKYSYDIGSGSGPVNHFYDK